MTRRVWWVALVATVSFAVACAPSGTRPGLPRLTSPPVSGIVGGAHPLGANFYGCSLTGGTVWAKVDAPDDAPSIAGIHVTVFAGYVMPGATVLGAANPSGYHFEGDVASVSAGKCFTVNVGIDVNVTPAAETTYTINW